jgi:hypothetical protein
MRSRRLALFLLALLLWAAAAPRATVACLPGTHCSMAGACSAMHAAASRGGSVTAPKCCQRSESPAPPATLQRLAERRTAPAVAVFVLPIQAGDAGGALAAAAVGRPGRSRPPAASAPLYTLHSVLLI